MMNNWKDQQLDEMIAFNPKESIKKGQLAKKIPMDILDPFKKNIQSYNREEFKGGTKFRNGDTLLARITPCLENGKTAKVSILEDDEIAFGSTEYIVMRAKENLSNEDFIYYLAISQDFRNIAIKSMVGSSGRQRAQLDVIKNTVMKFPPLPEQKAIADTLSCLDDKIELNNKINKNLEAQAQAIFKSWFVDFDPFQDGEFVDSELGRIPKGWRVCTIEDVVITSNTGGDAIQKTPMVEFDTGIKCVRVGDMTNNRPVNEWGFSNVSKDNFIKYQLKKNDIIVTRTACLGLNILIDEDVDAVYNNGLIRLKLGEDIIPLFFYHSINTDFYREYIGRIESESSTRPNMKINYLLNFKFVFPPIEIQKKLCFIMEAIREQRGLVIKQTLTLTNLRDTLLPKLMSGEVRVPPSQSIQD